MGIKCMSRCFAYCMYIVILCAYRVGKHDLIGSCTTTLKDICPEKYDHIESLSYHHQIPSLPFLFLSPQSSLSHMHVHTFEYRGGKVTELILTNPSSKHKDKWAGVLVFNSVK